MVARSSAHDRRRQKRLQRRLAEERNAWLKRKTLYFCLADVAAADQALQSESRHYHDLRVTVEERSRYA